jgi:hypothetical protein
MAQSILNVVVWINDEADQYGNNASIQISQSKEEREAGVKATYIGNLKEPQSRNNEPTSTRTESVADDVTILIVEWKKKV